MAEIKKINIDGTEYDLHATTAEKLNSQKTIALSGDITGSGSFDGSSNLTINTTIAKVFVAQSTAPSNTSLLWIDTANSNTMKFYYNGSWQNIHSVWA